MTSIPSTHARADLFDHFSCEENLARLRSKTGVYSMRSENLQLQAHVNTFRVSEGEFYGSARLEDDGGLNLGIVIKPYAGDQEDTIARAKILRGKEIYDAILKHFGDRVRYVKADWSFGDNLKAVNDMTADGLSLEEAIKATWSAQQAELYRYDQIEINKVIGKSGFYYEVIVNFFPKNNKPYVFKKMNRSRYEVTERGFNFSKKVSASLSRAGLLSFTIYDRDWTEGPDTVRNEADVFQETKIKNDIDKIFAHFEQADEVLAFAAKIDSSPDNETMNRLVQKKMSPENAAATTWIAAQAFARGFLHVDVTSTPAQNSRQRNYTLTFRR